MNIDGYDIVLRGLNDDEAVLLENIADVIESGGNIPEFIRNLSRNDRLVARCLMLAISDELSEKKWIESNGKLESAGQQIIDALKGDDYDKV